MMPYYLLFLIIYLSSYYDICKGDSFQIRNSLYYLGFLTTLFFFIIFTGLKGNVGTDYEGYFNLYSIWGVKNYSDRFVSVQIEPGFWLISHIGNLLKMPFPLFWFCIACITLVTKFIFFRKFSPYIFLSLLIYLSGLYIERDFDGIRQGLSIGLAYISILFYLDKKKIKYIIFLLLAISIHYSSLVFLIIPLLYRIQIKKRIAYIIISIGIIFMTLNVNIFSFALTFLPKGYIESRINTYMTNSTYAGNIGLNIGIIVRIAIFILFCNIDCKKLSITQDVYNFLRNGFLFSILCFLFFNNMEIIAHRLSYGYRELQIIIIPLCFKYYVMDRNFSNDLKVLAFQFYSFYAFILFYRMINTPHLKEYYEYHFIF